MCAVLVAAAGGVAVRVHRHRLLCSSRPCVALEGIKTHGGVRRLPVVRLMRAPLPPAVFSFPRSFVPEPVAPVGPVAPVAPVKPVTPVGQLLPWSRLLHCSVSSIRAGASAPVGSHCTCWAGRRQSVRLALWSNALPVPSWPLASMNTGLPLLLSTPLIPAIKVAV